MCGKATYQNRVHELRAWPPISATVDMQRYIKPHLQCRLTARSIAYNQSLHAVQTASTYILSPSCFQHRYCPSHTCPDEIGAPRALIESETIIGYAEGGG